MISSIPAGSFSRYPIKIKLYHNEAQRVIVGIGIKDENKILTFNLVFV